MIQVILTGSLFKIDFTHEGRQFDEIQITSSSNSRIYCKARKNGINYCTIAKQIKFDDNGDVYISFGKNTRLVIGKRQETTI